MNANEMVTEYNEQVCDLRALWDDGYINRDQYFSIVNRLFAILASAIQSMMSAS